MHRKEIRMPHNDPDATLAEFRALQRQIAAEIARYSTDENTVEAPGDAADHHDRLAELYRDASDLMAALDTHLTTGGHLPAAWNPSRPPAIATAADVPADRTDPNGPYWRLSDADVAAVRARHRCPRTGLHYPTDRARLPEVPDDAWGLVQVGLPPDEQMDLLSGRYCDLFLIEAGDPVQAQQRVLAAAAHDFAGQEFAATAIAPSTSQPGMWLVEYRDSIPWGLI